MGFRASQNPDTKKWNVFDIPVLPEVKFGDHDLNEKWMCGAIARARLRQGEGYRYRLHAHHHKTDKRTRPAGFFTPTTVRDHVYEGATARVLFVNYEDMPDEVYQEMKADGFPHRSLECLDVTRDVPEIDSISLLDTPTPKFRFKVTTGDTLEEVPFAASDEKTGGQVSQLVAESGPVHLYQSEDNHVLALFREVNSTMKVKLRFSEGQMVLFGEDGAEIKDGLSFSVNGTECEVATVELPEADNTALLAAEAKITELEAKLAAPAPKPVTGVAEIAEMRAQLDTLVAESTNTKLIASATKVLKDRGFSIGEELEADLEKYAAMGADTLNEYVESYAKFAAPEPPTFNGIVGQPAAADNTVVAKFVAEHPEQADAIRDASMEYEQAKAALGLKCSEESFISDRVGV